ncbi:MAG: ANTAR domain-containing protein [gamma proteobacterium symbiont of Bathyaustriella thionipta]|nr:ANTAR domain-containing protein [gamma proteobacterium symbiont of Bathyaustriella thionipta]
MQNILLVSSDTRHRALLQEAIDRENCSIVAVIKDTRHLADELSRQAVDLVVLDLNESAEAELEIIRQVIANKPLPIVMFVRQGNRESAAKATSAGVSAYVVGGLHAERVAPILAAAVTRFQETQILHEELDRTKAHLQERKIIERAKGLLMQQRSCTEEEAYAALRKLAMQRNKRLAEIANSVIDAASLLS